MKSMYFIIILFITNSLYALEPYVVDAGRNTTIVLGETITLEAIIKKGDKNNIEEYQWSERGKILLNTQGDEILYTDYDNRQNDYKPTTVDEHVLSFSFLTLDGERYYRTLHLKVNPKEKRIALEAGKNRTITQGDFILLDGLVIQGDKENIEEYQWTENGKILLNLLGDEILYTDYNNRKNDYKPTTIGKHLLTFEAIGKDGKKYVDHAWITVKKKYGEDFNKNAFITTWKTTPFVRKHLINIPTYKNKTYNYSIDWGDGTQESNLGNGDVRHVYDEAGNYNIQITGTFPAFDFRRLRPGNVIDLTWNKTIVALDQWGPTQWDTMETFFFDCPNLSVIAKDTPDLSKVSDATEMFYRIPLIKSNLSSWDVSNITDMTMMFSYATHFNQDLSSWNVSKVTDMLEMFHGATNFNQDISKWDVSKVKNFKLFLTDTAFNTENYDKLLIAWSKLNVQHGVVFDVNNTEYSIKAQEARNILINKFAWKITDAGLI